MSIEEKYLTNEKFAMPKPGKGEYIIYSNLVFKMKANDMDDAYNKGKKIVDKISKQHKDMKMTGKIELASEIN